MEGTKVIKVSLLIDDICFIAQNSSVVTRIANGMEEKITSAQLSVGDTVLIKDGDTFAADFALLTSSDNGDCFIKTSSLDGEKNLKKRTQCKDLKEYYPVTKLNLQEYSKI